MYFRQSSSYENSEGPASSKLTDGRARSPSDIQPEIGGCQLRAIANEPEMCCTNGCAFDESFSAPGRSIGLVIRHNKKTVDHLLPVIVILLHCIITDGPQGTHRDGDVRRKSACTVKLPSSEITWFELRKQSSLTSR